MGWGGGGRLDARPPRRAAGSNCPVLHRTTPSPNSVAQNTGAPKSMPAPTEVTNVVIEKGMSFSLEFDISNDDGTDYSLSGFSTASATIRKHAKSTIKEDFTTTFTSAGVITISLDTTQTGNLEVVHDYK